MATTFAPNPLAQFTFPRTGKRGVPQQFPRRLYEMLETETKQRELDPSHHVVISWSDSGRAFHIYDVTEFANVMLPKYFRTNKFSSFQRNLNLYGFAKVRRGPETDMYAHPFFLREQPQLLVNLRKMSTASRKQVLSDTSSHMITTTQGTEGARSVSPASTPSSSSRRLVSPTSKDVPKLIHALQPRLNGANSFIIAPHLTPAKKQSCDRGKLDLLALAMERETCHF